MNKKYVVRLSDDERGVCQEILKHLKGSSQKFRRAQILLKANADGPGWPDVRIAEAFNCREQTIENLRKRLVTEGFEWALEGKRRREPPTPVSPKTWSPSLNSFTSLPTASIFPANSVPGIGFFGLVSPVKNLPINGRPFRIMPCAAVAVVAYTLISTSLSLGVGFSTSLS